MSSDEIERPSSLKLLKKPKLPKHRIVTSEEPQQQKPLFRKLKLKRINLERN